MGRRRRERTWLAIRRSRVLRELDLGIGWTEWTANSVSRQCHHPKSLCIMVLESSLLASELQLSAVVGLKLCEGGVWREGGASV